MVETKYKSASGPEEIINKRMRNSGGEEADRTIKSGEGVRRVFHNIHFGVAQADRLMDAQDARDRAELIKRDAQLRAMEKLAEGKS